MYDTKSRPPFKLIGETVWTLKLSNMTREIVVDNFTLYLTKHKYMSIGGFTVHFVPENITNSFPSQTSNNSYCLVNMRVSIIIDQQNVFTTRISQTFEVYCIYVLRATLCRPCL